MKKIEERSEFKTMVQVGKISCNLLHDLISPITTLSLYSETIHDKKLRDALLPLEKATNDIKEFIALIQDAVEKPNQYYEINLFKTIEHALDLGKHKARISNVTIIFNYKVNKKLKIRCKKLEIYQVVMNLVGNSIDALKSCREKKIRKIIIEVTRDTSGNLIISVKDNGPGIKKGLEKKIFNKSFTTKKDGMGIGLNTVKKIVEKSFEGKIYLISNTKNYTDLKSIGSKSGAKFVIKIPLKNIGARD